MKKSLILFLPLFTGCLTFKEVPVGHKGVLLDSAASSEKEKVTILDHGRYNLGISPYKTIELYDTRWQTFREDHVEVITQDDLHIDVVASIIIRPNPLQIRKLHTEIGKNYYTTIVKSEFRTAIRNVLSSYPYVQIAKKSPDIEREIVYIVRSKVVSKYIEVDDVNFDDVNLSKEIISKIEEKLKRQQEAEAMKYIKRKAEEEADIAHIQAKKEAESEFIRAENESKINKMKTLREAEDEVIRAEARAKAQKLINSNLSANYLKLKALESHYKAFESPNSKIIFIPVGKDGLPVYINPNDKMFTETNAEEKKK